MKFQKIAILGAGAVGSYLIWGLSHKPELDVCVVASGERKKRMEQQGFVINGETYRPVIRTPEEARGADLLIVATKYTALREILDDVRVIVDDHTTVICLLNGVDSEEILAEAIGMEPIVHSLIWISSERKGNSVFFNPEAALGMAYGELDPSKGNARIEALNELFADTGLHYRNSDHILSDIWSKFRLNVPDNQVQAMIGCGIGAYRDSEHAAFLRIRLREELDQIAEAKGIEMDKKDSAAYIGKIVLETARYSTLQDLDAKRRTEVDMLAGSIVRMGRELGIPTPYNEFTYHMIKALEEKNEGRFDYLQD